MPVHLRLRLPALLITLFVLAVSGCSNDTAEEPPPPAPPASSEASEPTPTETPTKKPKPKPKPKPTDALNGGKVSKNGVYAVKIDNVAQARPQIGISAADIIVVEEVESSLTRLVAVFHSSYPKAVGPVRSARNTDVEFLPLFGKPGLVYSGANRKVQANVQGSKNLVAMERSDRDSSRPAPHNVVVNLADLAKNSKVGKAPKSIGWTFNGSEKAWKRAKKSGKQTEKVGADTFTFTRKGKRYQIAVNGDTYDDATTKKDLLADNIVVLSVKNRRDTDTTSNLSIVSETVGKGKVSITRNGKTITGTWQRKKVGSPMTFTDAKGKPIELKPGKTWLLLQG